MPLISIIVPVYKVERYLDKCVKSILSQTFTDFELILVDDGSPDQCGKMCDEYAKMDDRVKVIHKENGGISDARNAGIDIACGDFISFVDSDDYISRDMYEILYNLIKTYNADISMCNYYRISEDGKIQQGKVRDMVQCFNKETALKELLLERIFGNHVWGRLYKKELFSNIRFPKGVNYEDIGITFLLFAKCNNIVYSNKKKYFYVTREGNITGTKSESNIRDYMNMTKRRYQFIDNNFPQLNIYNVLRLSINYINVHLWAALNGLEDFYKDIENEYLLFKRITKKKKFKIMWYMNFKEKIHFIFLLLNRYLYKKLIIWFFKIWYRVSKKNKSL